jgi:hypothetical protein
VPELLAPRLAPERPLPHRHDAGAADSAAAGPEARVKTRGGPLARIARLLDAIYGEPDPFASAEQFARANHDDIGDLTLDEVDAERILVRIRWAALVHHRGMPSAWLQQRIARLDRAAQQLRARQGQRRA